MESLRNSVSSDSAGIRSVITSRIPAKSFSNVISSESGKKYHGNNPKNSSNNNSKNSSNSSLDLLHTKDDEFKEQYPSIMKKINTKKLNEMEPTLNEINKVNEIIFKFVKEKRRKIYGGFALNKLLVSKNPSLALYDETDQPDIDFYSPDPMGDLVTLCDKLHGAGLKSVTGQEAQHKETYSIYVNFKLYCDISYMPANIYNKIRYVQIDDFYLTHPWFMMIDYFRMFTDPLISYWRLEKHLPRYLKTQKNFPLPLITKQLSITPYKDKGISEAMNLMFDKMSEKPSLLFTGYYAYNYYLHVSEYKKYNKNYDYLFMPYIEAYSINYVEDGLDLIEYVKTLPEHISSRITHIEHYPFFQFYGYNVVFYYNDGEHQVPILYLYSNNKKCVPFKSVPLIKFDNLARSKPVVSSKTINVASFDFNILHGLIILVKVRVDDDNDWNDVLYKYINGLVMFRNYYLNNIKKTIYDETIFQGFVIDCLGETIPPERERRLIIQVRKKLGKPFTFRYEPGVSKKPNHYIFLNSSGNPIKKTSNFKLTEANRNSNLENELENEEKDDNSNVNKEDELHVQKEDDSQSEKEDDSSQSEKEEMAV